MVGDILRTYSYYHVVWLELRVHFKKHMNCLIEPEGILGDLVACSVVRCKVLVRTQHTILNKRLFFRQSLLRRLFLQSQRELDLIIAGERFGVVWFEGFLGGFGDQADGYLELSADLVLFVVYELYLIFSLY